MGRSILGVAGMKMVLLAVALALSSALAGASAQTLRIGLGDDPDLLDPTLSRTYVGRIVFAAICDKLVDIDQNLAFVPQLATEWRWTDDNKALVMTLRRGVTFHDGEKFDAAAVKFNIERHLNLPGSNRKAEIAAVQAVEIVDDHTVRLVLSRPFAPLLAALSDRAGMMVSPKAAGAADFASRPVCAGPYKFVERVAQDRIVLERFAGYWDREAMHVERLVFLPVTDHAVRLANLQSGSLDLIERVAAPHVEEVRKNPRLKLTEATSLGYTGLTINLNSGPRSKTPLGQDARVRQALELSIDRAALNAVVFDGLFRPGNQWVSPENPYYVKSIPIPPRDVAKARQLLAEAQTPNPTVTLMVPTNPELLRAAEVIQAMAKEAGFDIRIEATEFATSLDRAAKGDFEAYLIGWSGRTDPDGNIYNFLACDAPPALNTPRYCNPEIDRELNAARTTGNQSERREHYARVAERALADRPIIYLWHGKLFFGMREGVEGFLPYPDGLIRPRGLRIK
jgi:peptide/nickel transport system substrate-binding protein